jgi:hypothetical protein
MMKLMMVLALLVSLASPALAQEDETAKAIEASRIETSELKAEMVKVRTALAQLQASLKQSLPQPKPEKVESDAIKSLSAKCPKSAKQFAVDPAAKSSSVLCIFDIKR